MVEGQKILACFIVSSLHLSQSHFSSPHNPVMCLVMLLWTH